MLHGWFSFFGGHDKRIVSKVLKAPREFASNIKNYDEYECDISNLNFHFKWKSENTLNNHELTGKCFLNCIILFMELKVRPNIHETLLHYGFSFQRKFSMIYLHVNISHLSFTFKYSFEIYFHRFCYGLSLFSKWHNVHHTYKDRTGMIWKGFFPLTSFRKRRESHAFYIFRF